MKDNHFLIFIRKISQVLLLFIGVYASLMCATVRLDVAADQKTVTATLLIFSFAIWGLFSFLDDFEYGKFVAAGMGAFLLIIFYLRFGAVCIKGAAYAVNSILKLAMTYYNIKLELFSYSPEAAQYGSSYSATIFLTVLGVILLFILSISFYKKRRVSIYLLFTLPFFVLPYLVGRTGFYKEMVLYLVSVAAVFATGHAKSYVMENKLKEKVSLLLTGIVLICALLGYLIYSPSKYEKNREELIVRKSDLQTIFKWSGEDFMEWVKANLSADVMSYGLVGQKDKVVYTGKKILEIRPAVVTKSSLYLKGFIGDKYHDGKWTTYNSKDTEYTNDLNILKKQLGGGSGSWEVLIGENNAPGRDWNTRSGMDIKNIAMGRGKKVLPYYPTKDFSYDEKGHVQWSGGISYSVDYYCRLEEQLKAYYNTGIDGIYGTDYRSDAMSAMTAFVSKYYLDIPKGIKEKTLSDFSKWYLSRKTGNEKISIVKNKVQAVRDYLIYSDEYEYTLSPGKTPEGKDSLDYFLNENKKGYCVHFASAAVLMLRSLGVPTRFAEGVCVENDRLVKYVEKKDPYVAVLDEDAHAWVEVYVEGYGFIPMDFTPGSTEEDNDNTQGQTDPSDIRQNESTPTPEPTAAPMDHTEEEPEEEMEFEDIERDNQEDTGETEDDNGVTEPEINESGTGNNSWIIILITVISIPVLIHGQWMVRQRIYINSLKKKNETERVIKMYFYIRPLLAAYDCSYKSETISEYKAKIAEKLFMKEEQVESFVRTLMKAEFADGITKEEFFEYKKSYRLLRGKMIKKASLIKKIIFRYIYNQ